MKAQPSNIRIIGVAMVLFFGVLLGVGIHHMIRTGTCSSTGYSANYGPVPTCPSGTGLWFAFLFSGIIGTLIGALMAGSMSLVFGGIFGAIGFGALTLLVDPKAHGGTRVFGAIFGGCFAIVGVIAGGTAIMSAISSLRRSGSKPPASAPSSATSFVAPQTNSAFGTPQAAAAFGASGGSDAILSAYEATRGAAPMSATPGPAATMPVPPLGSPVTLIPGLQAAKQVAAGHAVDELAKLSELHQKGALTDDEFASAKAKLLGQM